MALRLMSNSSADTAQARGTLFKPLSTVQHKLSKIKSERLFKHSVTLVSSMHTLFEFIYSAIWLVVEIMCFNTSDFILLNIYWMVFGHFHSAYLPDTIALTNLIACTTILCWGRMSSELLSSWWLLWCCCCCSWAKVTVCSLTYWAILCSRPTPDLNMNKITLVIIVWNTSTHVS